MAASTFQSLRNARFRRYWYSQLPSQVGSWMQASAQAWLVLGLFSDPGEATVKLGLVSALQWVPALVLSLHAGALLDRVSRKGVLVVTQSTLLGTAALLGTAVLTGRVTFGLVAAMALVSGVANTFDIVARQSLVPNLVPREDVSNAVALNSLSMNVARVLGASVFGLLSPLVGMAAVFYLNAASFLGVIWVVAGLRMPPPEPHRTEVLTEIKEGLVYVWHTRAVRQPVFLLAALSVTAINFQVIIPVFAKTALRLGEGGFGLLGSAFGLGAVAGAVWNASRPGVKRTAAMTLGGGLLAVSLGLLGLSPGTVAASLVLVGAGVGMIVFLVNANSSVQLATPDELRGRVMSVYTLVFAGLSPFGALLVGGLMGRLGPRVGVAAVAGLALLAVATMRPTEKRVPLAQPTD